MYTVNILEVKRPKVKVIRPINAHSKWPISSEREGQKTSNLVHRRSTKTRINASAVTSKVKGQGRKVTLRFWQMLADMSRTKCPRNTTIGRKVVHPTSNNAHQFQRHKVMWSAWELLAHYWRTQSPRNTKIGGKVARATGNNAIIDSPSVSQFWNLLHKSMEEWGRSSLELN